MKIKSITSIALLMVQVCLPSSEAKTLVSGFYPVAADYEEVVKKTCLQDGKVLSQPQIGPVRAYLAKAFLKFGREGVNRLLNNDVDCIPLKESLQAYRNRDIFFLELRNGANANAAIAGKGKQRTYVDLAKEMDTKPENSGKNFAQAIEDAAKIQLLEALFCEAKCGVDTNDVTAGIRALVTKGSIQEAEVLRFIDEEIKDLEEQANALRLVKKCFASGPYSDEEKDIPANEIPGWVKMLFAGTVCVSVGGILGAAIVSSK